MKIKMVVTDLDGTLARSDSQICPVDLSTLDKLGDMGICRVIATGRSLFSARRVLDDKFPIDYLIFSSGAGVLDWHSQEIINEEHLSAETVRAIAGTLTEQRVDFCVQDPIPNNHRYCYTRFNPDNQDFNRRLELYREHTRPLVSTELGDASQLLAILGEDPAEFDALKRRFDPEQVKIIRATSPLNGRSIWMEFFPPHVSKSFGIGFLCAKLQIDREQTVGIGNDYNDVDLLKFCRYSFVVANAPEELKRLYPAVASNDMNGFTHLINNLTRSEAGS